MVRYRNSASQVATLFLSRYLSGIINIETYSYGFPASSYLVEHRVIVKFLFTLLYALVNLADQDFHLTNERTNIIFTRKIYGSTYFSMKRFEDIFARRNFSIFDYWIIKFPIWRNACCKNLREFHREGLIKFECLFRSKLIRNNSNNNNLVTRSIWKYFEKICTEEFDRVFWRKEKKYLVSSTC